MTAVSDKWLKQRQPPTGPQGAPTDSAGGVETTVQTSGATGTGGGGPGYEDIDLSAIFTDPTYADWTGFASSLNVESDLCTSVIKVGTEWHLIVWAPPAGAAAVPAGVSVRVKLLPQGVVLP